MKILDENVRVSASDLANFLACRHLTRLDLLKAHGQLKPAWAFDIGFQALGRPGEEHERSVLGRFREEALDVVEISSGLSAGAEGTMATAAAIGRAVDVIYQAVLLRPATSSEPELLGRPDFLVRSDLLPAPDGGDRPDGAHYEVVDAKLARSAKARAVLQSAFYSRLLADVQGIEPRWMHLALGNGEFASFRVSDYAAHERQVHRLLNDFIRQDRLEVLQPEETGTERRGRTASRPRRSHSVDPAVRDH
jgi:predicted RecB family nuclease